MGRYRVTTTIIHEIESSLEHDVILREAETEIDAIMGNRDILRRHIKLDRLRDRRYNIQLGVFKPEDVLPYICQEEAKRDYIIDGKTYSVRMNSQRYFTFRDSLSCAACGLIGTKMILEQQRDDGSPHFNLYGEENGRLVLFTKDHTRPKSQGGGNHINNMKTCCCICNNIKGNYNLTYIQVKQLRELYNSNCKLSRKKLALLIRQARKEILCRN